MANLTAASQEWFSRPEEERFLSLTALHNHMLKSQVNSSEKIVELKSLTARPVAGDETGKALEFVGQNGGVASMTHYAFGQVAEAIGAPRGFLGSLSANVAAMAVNEALAQSDKKAKMLVRVNGEGDERALQMRAFTSPGYGRVYNAQVTRALVDRFGNGVDGDWRVPGEFGEAVKINKSNTTFYGNDKNMFVFLADETNRIEIPNRRDGKPGSLARGFYVGNSEVGAGSLILCTFLFDYACSNRTIWGAEGVREFKLKHSQKVGERWLDEIAPAIHAYGQASATPIETQIKLAQASKIEPMEFFTGKMGMRPKLVNQIIDAHKNEENRPIETLWDGSVGITALAKSLPYQEERIELERIGGKLLDLVAA